MYSPRWPQSLDATSDNYRQRQWRHSSPILTFGESLLCKRSVHVQRDACPGMRTVTHDLKTCHRFRQVVQDSTEIRYTVALAAAGLRDCGQQLSSSVDKYRKLEEYEIAWRSMRWADHIVVKNERRLRLLLPSNPLVWLSEVPSESPRIDFSHQHSILRGTDDVSWTIRAAIDHPSISYSLIISQDLLIVQTSEEAQRLVVLNIASDKN